MDIQEYISLDDKAAVRPKGRMLGICRDADIPLHGCLPQIGDYATLYIKTDREILIGETKGMVKVLIAGIVDGRYYGTVCDSHYDNPLPIGTNVSFHSETIFSVSNH